jgi:eukaryotic-like serine/threonine-protein kinase
MVRRMVNCDESRLKSFLDDDLADLEQAELADHLGACASCRHTLERLAAGTRLWAELRQLTPGAANEPRFAPAMAPTGLHGAISPCDGGSERDRSLEFLAPSDTPGSLGRMKNYEITQLLGRGGFGMVLKAFDPALSRVVAIKVLAPQLATSAAARGRFAREARAAAAVVHEHVVAIHAVDSWSNLPYLVMPFVAGRSLQERVDSDGPLGVKEVLRIGMQTAQGLAAAHAQGLVHRDVKPSNILLENGVERVKLTDFGLARAVDDASMTQSGVVAGTPQYMSPEQARGEAVDHRSDLFSLGSVLYFMCAGHPPFRASSTPAVLRRVSDDPPRPLREVNLEVPAWLADIVARLHQKDPGSRFASALEVADILGRLLADLQRGVPIAMPREVSAAAKPQRGRRKTAIAATVMIPALVLAFAGYWKSDSVLSLLPAIGQFAHADAANAPPGRGQDGNVTLATREPSKTTIIGSGHPATKDVGVADFDSLEIVHPFEVEIIRADSFGVTVTADDNVLEHVEAIKKGSSLKINLAEGKLYRIKRGSLKTTVRMPTLLSLGLSHGARGTVRGFKSNRDLNVRASHGSTLDGEVEAGNLEIEASHGSTLQLKGKARDGRLAASHGSTLSLSDLALRAVEVSVEHGSTSKFDARSTDGFKVTATHGSVVNGSVEAGHVVVETGHSSSVTLKGRAQRADVEASHGCRLALGGLALDAAEVDLDQSSSATVNAKDALDYQIANGSSLKYVGQPKIGQSQSSRSSSARSISADEAVREYPKPSREPSKPPQLTDKDIIISTVRGGFGSLTIGDSAADAIVGSGIPATKTWDIVGFDKVQIRSTFRADITKGPDFKVITTADDNVLPQIKVVKDGTTLEISLDHGSYRLKSPLKAEITLPAIVGLDINGASRGTLNGFQSERALAVKLSGASELTGGINVETIKFDVNGASALSLVGSAKEAQLSAEGASRLNLREFAWSQGPIVLTGASTAHVKVKSDGPFQAKLEGASTLDGSIEATEIELELDGASQATLEGKATNAKILVSGAGNLKTPGLVFQNAQVKLSGASHATIDARSKLLYDVSSGSSLKFLGNPPTVEGTKSGGSSISRAR